MASGKPVANGQLEGGFSRAKHISADDRQAMRADSLQYTFIAMENETMAEPVLGVLVRRFLEARRHHMGSFLAPPPTAEEAPDASPAELFVWEDAETFKTCVGSCRADMTPLEPFDVWVRGNIDGNNRLIAHVDPEDAVGDAATDDFLPDEDADVGVFELLEDDIDNVGPQPIVEAGDEQ